MLRSWNGCWSGCLYVARGHSCGSRRRGVSIVGLCRGKQGLDQNKHSIDSVPKIDPDRLHLTKVIVAGRIPQRRLYGRCRCERLRDSRMSGVYCALLCILVSCSSNVSRLRRASALKY